MFPKDIMSGGTGIYYSANQILFMGRQQEKDGTEVSGYNFMMGVEKSRFVREKTRLPLSISWEGGINKWSGLLDIGLELGWVTKPSVGWFEGTNPKTGEVFLKKRKAETNSSEYWIPLLKAGFADAIKERYAIGSIKSVVEEHVEETIEEDTAADND